MHSGRELDITPVDGIKHGSEDLSLGLVGALRTSAQAQNTAGSPTGLDWFLG